jgi:peptidoglycan/xylan/chitin deacetylase (PgdA/CDA1 family)
MTRFHIHLFVVALVMALAIFLGNYALLVGALFVSFVLINLGVVWPRLSLFGPFLCHGANSRRCVALTFDDGPDARSTPALLELLREARVEVAFFAIGKRVVAEPDLAARIVREGHLLENHSFAHSNLTNFFTIPRLQAELAQAQAAIQQATGVAPKCFRPPMGLSNPNVFHAARALGLKVVGWTARGFDTQVKNPELVVNRIVRQLHPGAIILLHDGNIPAERLLVTVKLLLAKLHERDYEVVRLDRMLP